MNTTIYNNETSAIQKKKLVFYIIYKIMINYNKAFRAYDIRWIFWEEIDNYFCFLMGYGIWIDLIKKHGNNATILLWSDTRKANKELMDNFINGLTNGWVNNISFIKTYTDEWFPYGIISSSAAYYIGMNDRDMTAIFTASHNPAEYTGIKTFDKKWSLTDTKYLYNLFVIAQKEWQWKKIPNIKEHKNNNKKVEEKIYGYHKYLKEKRDTLKKNHHFVVDFCHWAAVSAEKSFYKNILTTHFIHSINDYPDWTFPSHEWDTSDVNNYKQLIHEVKKHNAEFGIMFDWDADRVWFVSKGWKVIPGDIIYAIIVTEIIKEKEIGNPICVYDCMSSKIVKETIEDNWGIAKINKVGRFFINNEMQRIWALIWWEVSWHYMFGELWSVESVLLAQYYVMKAIENHNSFDDLVKKYEKYYKWQIQSIKVENKEITMEKIQKYFQNKEIILIDGVSIYDTSYRCNIRASNTENKIRFTVEADNEKIRSEKVNELKKLIENKFTIQEAWL
jgi:phosphomannomutase